MIDLISSLMSSGCRLVVTACFPIKMSPIRHNLTDCSYALGFSIGDCNIYEELYLPSPFNMYFTDQCQCQGVSMSAFFHLPL